jgi:purine-nucleoside phosphorylase
MIELEKTISFIQSKISQKPQVGIILGSGLGSLVKSCIISSKISYSEIPNFPISTVEGHEGNLLFGELSGKQIVIMQGRFHYYEGYSMEQITFPVKVMKQLGIEYLFVSNATGGLNPLYKTGDLMIIKDHINFFPEHPLRGKNNDLFGVRFPDMSETYNKQLIVKAQKIAIDLKISIHTGVYIGSSGPSLETPAEYNMFRVFGADVTGMSTVPEVIVAHHAGIKCFGISVVTNESKDAQLGSITTHDEVQQNAALAEPRMTKIFQNLIKEL